MPATLSPLLSRALEQRAALIDQLASESTNAYRLFHGDAEGMPGVVIDRYNDLLLVQSFAQTLTPSHLDAIRQVYQTALPDAVLVYNDRSGAHAQIANPLAESELEAAMAAREVLELGVQYHIQARHGGQAPWLPIATRALRRKVMQESAGKSVLNLFAYTGSAGLAAAKAGARHVINIEQDETSIMVGKEIIRLNSLATRPRFVQSEFYPAVRQYAGIGQPLTVRGKRMPTFTKLEPRQFDLVVLDPPAHAKSLFGVVDLLNDYPSVFKPALLSTVEGGTLLCTHQVASVDGAAWLDQLQRSAIKAGRQVQSYEWISTDADVPDVDGQPVLKTLLLRV